jgi:electron transfer flavoprotein beta subunit
LDVTGEILVSARRGEHVRIVVCVKDVGVLGDEIEIDPSGVDVDPDYLERALNEWDAAAVEEALVLREAAGDGEVVVVCAGDEDAGDTILRALAMGADRAVRIDRPTGTNLDPVGLAGLLAEVVRAEGPDLVLCGAQSADAAHGATGAALAGHLHWPCAAVARRLAWQPGAAALVGRELDGGTIAETRVETPAVLTIQTGINQPRYATLRAIKQAAEKPLDVVEPASDAAYARVVRMYVPDRGAGAEMLGNDADAVAARIVALVRGEA